MSSQQLAKVSNSPLAIMAAKFNADPAKLLDTLKATVFSAARNNEELQALVIVSNQYGLNPLTKEIYAFPAKGGGIVPVVSIDGWANLANSHPAMDGVDFEWCHDEGKLVSCTAIIFRKDRTHPTRITEYLSECKRATDPWKMEHRMLRHKAFCQCVRIAFGFSGIYDEDEAERTQGVRDVTPSAATSPLFKDVPAKPIYKDLVNAAENADSPAASNAGQQNESAALFDTPDISPIEAVLSWLTTSGVKWATINETLYTQGVTSDLRTTPEECNDTELRDILGMKSQLEAVKKGSAQ